MLRCGIAVWIVLLGAAAPTAAQLPSFDVASLKPSPPPEGDTYRANLGTIRHGELAMTNVTLSDILRFAFTITNDEQIAGPDWIRNKRIRFDVLAKAPPETSNDDIRLMLQGLLKERFKLTYHREPRELAYLALEVGKKGSKLQQAQEGSAGTSNKFWPGDIVTKRVSMQMLATVLSRFLKEPILDETGLKGDYEVTLNWSPDNPEPPSKGPDASPLSAADATGPSIFTAVQKQLGLQLEGRKHKLDVIVIDHADQVPAGN